MSAVGLDKAPASLLSTSRRWWEQTSAKHRSRRPGVSPPHPTSPTCKCHGSKLSKIQVLTWRWGFVSMIVVRASWHQGKSRLMGFLVQMSIVLDLQQPWSCIPAVIVASKKIPTDFLSYSPIPVLNSAFFSFPPFQRVPCRGAAIRGCLGGPPGFIYGRTLV